MTLKKLVVAAFAFAALMLPGVGAFAQDANAPAAGAAPAAAAPVDPKLNWLKVCNPLADGKKACMMRQVVLVNGVFIGSFLLRDDPSQESRLLGVGALPNGVLLPMGMLWQIDNDKPLRVPYILCDPQSCLAQTVVNETYVNKLKKGGTLKIIGKNKRNEDLTVEINLAGFTAVYDTDTELTVDEYNRKASGTDTLGSALEDQAQKMRQELDSGATPPADGTAPAGQ